MALPRKDQAKINYLNSPEGQALQQSAEKHNISLDQISDEVLPDDFEFTGWKVVDGGIFCKTAGEYKAALAKEHDTKLENWTGCGAWQD